MRLVLLASLICLSALAQAEAQTPPAPGTPAAPESPAPESLAPKTSAPTPSKVHGKKPRHAARARSHAAKADAFGDADSAPLDSAHIAAPPAQAGRRSEDPLSFGMKWNANSDSARETRVQNYRGDAPGEGAEVGVKLHF